MALDGGACKLSVHLHYALAKIPHCIMNRKIMMKSVSLCVDGLST